MRTKRGSIFIWLGLLLIAAALLLTGYNLYDDYRADSSAAQAVEELRAMIPTATATPEPVIAGAEAAPEATPTAVPYTEMEIPDYVLNPNMDMPVIRSRGQDYIGTLQIPALELEIPVISQWSYPKLRIAPCRYSGSAYSGGLVISGHNYGSHFGKLPRLKPGDDVVFTDADGNRFEYEVILLETLEPTQVKEMISEEWDLSLFTCTVGGSYRVTVRCMQKLSY